MTIGSCEVVEIGVILDPEALPISLDDQPTKHDRGPLKLIFLLTDGFKWIGGKSIPSPISLPPTYQVYYN